MSDPSVYRRLAELEARLQRLETVDRPLVGTGTAGRIAQWAAGGQSLADSTLAKTGAGVLTIDADDTQTFVIDSGTYTPTATGATTAGTQTYTTQLGRWQRLGQTIIAHVYLDWTANTGTGTLVISLPFAARVSVTQRYSVSVFADGLPFTGAHLQGQIVAGESRFSLSAVAATGVRTNVPVDAAAIIIAAAIYEVD